MKIAGKQLRVVATTCLAIVLLAGLAYDYNNMCYGWVKCWGIHITDIQYIGPEGPMATVIMRGIIQNNIIIAVVIALVGGAITARNTKRKNHKQNK